MSAFSVADLLATLERRGVRLRAEGERLVYEAPAGPLGDADRPTMRARRGEVLALLRQRQAQEALRLDWSRVSLWTLDRILEVAVPWSDVPLVLAPGCRIARALRARDPKPGRVWCVCEVLDLLLTSLPVEDARRIAEAKLVFDGALTRVRKGEPA